MFVRENIIQKDLNCVSNLWTNHTLKLFLSKEFIIYFSTYAFLSVTITLAKRRGTSQLVECDSWKLFVSGIIPLQAMKSFTRNNRVLLVLYSLTPKTM